VVVAGRIRDEDIALVRERTSITEVVSERVTLKPGGHQTLKGLCPFHDEKTPSFTVRTDKNVYYCLAGDTRVLTWEGVRPIRELAGGKHRVLGRGAHWVEAPFKSYGFQRLWRISLTRDRQEKVIYATAEHRWFVRSGVRKRDTKEVVTRDLQPHHRLAYVYPRNHVRRTTISSFGVAHGITYGDGSLNRSGATAQLVGEKDAQLTRFFKDRPSPDESHPYLLGWLAGYFAADGTVAEDGTVSLHSADRADLEFVRLICSRLGIGTYGVTEFARAGFPDREPTPLFRVHLLNEDLPPDFFLTDKHKERFASADKEYSRRAWTVRSVEPTDRVEEVYCAEVDDGHAFVLEDNILTGNCHGCAKGGDAISFVMEVEHLSFVETVELLAGRAGINLRYIEAGPAPTRAGQGQRQRLVAAHTAAAEFYAEQLLRPDARTAREFLAQRGFDRDAAQRYGCGYAPEAWEALTAHLRRRGFTEDELVTGGLSRRARSGSLIDRFRGRLLWPIRDITGGVVGFGARRLGDDGPKYLNTPETPIYKKSQVLYGIDHAKREIAKQGRAVIVEGYTDVMACHLAGVPTAVATCGTAFGDEHVGVLRRLLMDTDSFAGEIIFTFDGDAAGQQAALRAFESDQRFVGRTFIAVSPDGMDPCDLRLAKGDVAVRDLVARREPLVDFALRQVLARYDLDTVDGRVEAMRRAAPLVGRLKDREKRPEYARKLAGDLGMPVEQVSQAVAGAVKGSDPVAPRQRGRVVNPATVVEREALKLAIQEPVLAGPLFDAVGVEAYHHPLHAAIRTAIAEAGGAVSASSGPVWVQRVRDACTDLAAGAMVGELAVEPLRLDGEPDPRYVGITLAKLELVTVDVKVAELKSKVQRVNPVTDKQQYLGLAAELFSLEQRARALRDRAAGSL
jgi:DNA primase